MEQLVGLCLAVLWPPSKRLLGSIATCLRRAQAPYDFIQKWSMKNEYCGNEGKLMLLSPQSLQFLSSSKEPQKKEWFLCNPAYPVDILYMKNTGISFFFFLKRKRWGAFLIDKRQCDLCAWYLFVCAKLGEGLTERWYSVFNLCKQLAFCRLVSLLSSTFNW